MDQTIVIVGAIVIVGVLVCVVVARQLKANFSATSDQNGLSRVEEANEAKNANALLNQSLSAAKHELALKESKLEKLLEEVKALTAEVAKLSSEKEQLTARNNEHQEKNSEISANLKAAKDELVRAQLNIKEKEAKLEAEVKRLEAQQLDFEKQKSALTTEFKVLSEAVLKSRQEDLKKQNNDGIKALLAPLENQLKGFKEQVETAHNEGLKNHSSLERHIKHVMEMGIKMSDEASNLSSALKGKSQTRGAWGEAMLERSLEMSGLVKDTHYTSQNSQLDEDHKRKRPDILIKVPGGKNLIIDSKVTLNAYEKLVAAETDDEAAIAMAEHVRAVRSHMDDLSKKNYDQVAEFKSPDFVLMFMPIEAAYIEALKHDGDLYSYGYQRRIVLVSHTTLIPILRTVANLWTIDQGNRAAKDIADRAGDIYNTVSALAENVLRMGSQLKTVSGTYNKVVNGLTGQRGLFGKVERFSQISEKVKKQLPDIPAQHIDIDTEKLEVLELAEQDPDTTTET